MDNTQDKTTPPTNQETPKVSSALPPFPELFQGPAAIIVAVLAGLAFLAFVVLSILGPAISRIFF